MNIKILGCTCFSSNYKLIFSCAVYVNADANIIEAKDLRKALGKSGCNAYSLTPVQRLCSWRPIMQPLVQRTVGNKLINNVSSTIFIGASFHCHQIRLLKPCYSQHIIHKLLLCLKWSPLQFLDCNQGSIR